MISRRKFLKFLGMAPAAPMAATAAEKFAGQAKALEQTMAPEPKVETYTSAKPEDYQGTHCTVSCCSTFTFIRMP